MINRVDVDAEVDSKSPPTSPVNCAARRRTSSTGSVPLSALVTASSYAGYASRSNAGRAAASTPRCPSWSGIERSGEDQRVRRDGADGGGDAVGELDEVARAGGEPLDGIDDGFALDREAVARAEDVRIVHEVAAARPARRRRRDVDGCRVRVRVRGGVCEGLYDESRGESVLVPSVASTLLHGEGILDDAVDTVGGDDAPVLAALRRHGGERARGPDADDVTRALTGGGESHAALVRHARHVARGLGADVLLWLVAEQVDHRLARVRHARLEEGSRRAGDRHDPPEGLRGAAGDVQHRAHGRGVHSLERHA